MKRTERVPLVALLCAWVLAGASSCNSGKTERPSGPACSIQPSIIDFGTINTGQSVTRTFSITNTGGGALSGSVAACLQGPFQIIGPSSYSLGAGQSATISVRYAPTAPGTHTCAITPGSQGCSSVQCAGSAESSAICAVLPISLDFGTVVVGRSEDRTFSISNTGQGTLAGSVTLSCPAFSLRGTASYSLGAGESKVVTVRFTPTAGGAQACTINTGTGCSGVSATGTGELGPACQVDPATLAFGTVVVGQAADRTFTIRNNGGGALAGSVTLSCPAFSLVGTPSYSLGTGESTVVTVRFTPAGGGALACTINTGTGCGGVSATGTGELSTICLVDSTALAFGTLVVGQTADRTFTIRNGGTDVLAGTVALSCPAFSLLGTGSYSLGAGQFQSFTVRFTPTGAGNQNCTVSTGAGCSSVSATGTGELPPFCQVDLATLAFGTVVVGQTADRSITIRNSGGGTLAGSVTLSCPAFSLVGAASYSLGAGLSQQFTVRFTPTGAGVLACTINTGTACASVSATGTGDLPPSCHVDLATLAFGTVVVGQTADRSFTIRNGGGGTLAGSVTLSCPAFSLVGTATFSLGAGQSQPFTVRFTPAGAGSQACTINAGAGCSPLSATGTGDLPSACRVDPAILNFGTVVVGQTADRTFTISNSGGGALAGSVTLSCPAFSLVGAASYSLEAGQSQSFTARFTPTGAGNQNCTVSTGAGCGSVSATGTGELPPSCQVDLATLAFGTVVVGQTADRSFTISNSGGGTLAGSVTLSCPAFSLVGAASYSLGAGLSQQLTVRFAPTGAGNQNCTVSTGTGCGSVSASGTGELPPTCFVAPATLDFGEVPITHSADSTFTVTNVGGGTLSGTVSSPCPQFVIIGTAVYSLGAEQVQTFTVRFAPTEEGLAPPAPLRPASGPLRNSPCPTQYLSQNCTIGTGAGCAGVAVSGTGVVGILCRVTPDILDFASVPVYSTQERSFTITNEGGGTISSTVWADCEHFWFVGDSTQYTLNDGESQTFRVLYTPSHLGTDTCTLHSGLSCCPDVQATATALPPTNTGACCAPAGTCTLVPEVMCATSRVWQGVDTNCTPNPCPQPTGACCASGATCTVTTQDACAVSGVWQGSGTSCTPNLCDPGACCAPGGICSLTQMDLCWAAGGGRWTLHGVCAPNPCPQGTGACCAFGFSCTITTQADCPAPSVWKGAGTSCVPFPCSTPGSLFDEHAPR